MPTDNDVMMLGIAVVGAGQWGPNLIRNFHDHPSATVLHVVDKDAARLRLVQERMPQIEVGGDLDLVLDDDAVDAVVVAAPTATHFELARRSLERGKHVLVEKPMAARLSEALELCELARRHGLTLMVGHVFLYNQAIRAAKQIIDSGELGSLFHVSMTRTNLGPVRLDVNAAWDLAAHDISIANYWLGAQPESVSATGGSWLNRGLQDAVFVSLRYGGGVVVNIQASWLSPRKVRDISVVGEKKMLTVDDMNLAQPLWLYDKGVNVAERDQGFVDTFSAFRANIHEGTITIPRVGAGEPLKTECSEFIDCIQAGEPPISDGWVGASVVRVLEAIDHSMGAGGLEVAIHPDRHS